MIETCTFETPRLRVAGWHALADRAGIRLPAVVAEMLTEPVTRDLPPDWQGSYDPERAAGWIAERDRESTVLLVVEQPEQVAVGLVILFETADDAGGLELRLGYLLAEAAWGRGLATELLEGLVEWCQRSGVASVVGGVAPENLGSRRVLEKAGFVVEAEEDQNGSRELLYRLKLAG